MRTFVLLLSGCAALLGQNASDNAAAESLKKRIEGMRLVNPQGVRPAPQVILRQRTAETCAIPLLNVIPPDAGHSRMPVTKPPVITNDREIHVPAPACDHELFQNR